MEILNEVVDHEDDWFWDECIAKPSVPASVNWLPYIGGSPERDGLETSQTLEEHRLRFTLTLW